MKRFLATITITVLLCVPSAPAQSTSSKQFREYSDRLGYLDFNDAPDLCDGQVLNNGLICVMNLSEDQRPARRLAMLSLLNTETFTSVTTRLFELEPNEAGGAFVVIMRRYVLPTESDLPLLRAVIKEDGSVLIDAEYGDYPPQFSAEEEASNTFERYEAEIRKLLEALIETR